VLNNDRNFAILEAVSLAVSIIAVAMSALNVLTALVMATQERTREIGIFAAIGWSNARIMMSIVIEGILMCVSGCVSAHSRNRQPDLVQAERRPDRAGRRCSLRALRSWGAVAGVAGGSDGTCGGAAAPVSARQRRGRAGGSES
jgi:hypothetical protein